MYPAPSHDLQPRAVGVGTTEKVLAVPCRKVVSEAKEAWPNWFCARLSFDCSRCSHPPISSWWRPRVQKTWSSNVKRFRVVALLEPTFAPAPVICEEPFDAVDPAITMAPTGLPATHPGTGTPPSGEDASRTMNEAREKPKR